MSGTIYIKGFFSGERGKPLEGEAVVSISGPGMNESLAVEFSGRYRVDFPCRAAEKLAADARELYLKAGGGGAAVERESSVDGFYTDSGVRMKPAKIHLWLRNHGMFETLTMEAFGKGQISLPYQMVADIIRKDRRNLV